MKTKAPRWLRVLLVAAALIPVGGPVTAGELSGNGEWQSLSAEAIKGTWSVVLSQNGQSIEGTLTLTGSNVFKTARVSGHMDAAKIAFGVVSEAGKQASFNGKLDGSALSGEWESSLVGDHGVWYGTLAKN